jgi:proteasome lid subunit RPN8/RPN11
LPETIQIPEQIRQAILVHAENCRPNECCGLLASDSDNQLRFAYPLTNIEESPVGYTIDPDEHYAALTHAERTGWHVSGVFHSHPSGVATPSLVDVQTALEPAWVYVIVSPNELRSWRITRGTVSEVSTT